MTKTKALAHVSARQRRYTEARETAERERDARDDAVLAAFDAGNTYADLASALDLTEWRVTQILRKARKRAATPA